MKLEVDNVIKAFGKHKVLNNCSLQINQNEIVGLFGRNGSGKSTLLKLIFGTLKAQSIKIRINSELIQPEKIIPQKCIAYLPQFNFLPQNLKVRDIIPIYFEDGDKQDKIFYAPKIASFEKLKPGELSMGQLKYFEILLISHLNHPFVMLDEPFSMIDPLFKDLIKEQLIELKKTKGILITDHYYKDVLQITDRNYLLKNGKMVNILDKSDLNQHGYLTNDQV
jgi:ABC-type multidrug transport system ATPase subunit